MASEVTESGSASVSPTSAAEALGDRGLTVLFALTSFVAAALLFSVEPMIARMLLPQLGGSAAVWNTALVFFQVALLAGYGWAHLVLRRSRLPRAMGIQLATLLLAAVVLPVGLPEGWRPPSTGSPTAWTLATLAAGVGAPFVALSTLSPTLQRWLASTSHPRAADPYFLYAAGNAGSLVALLAYPITIEPALGLRAQSRAWSAGYGVAIVLTAACAMAARRRAGASAASPSDHGSAPEARATAVGTRRWHWLVLAAVPSALLAAVTRHLATDVASIPMLWVLPLSAYLATFIAAFGRRGPSWTRWGTAAARPLAIVALLEALTTVFAPLPGMALHLVAFSAVSMAAHGRLASERPDPRHLTTYYFTFSLGGVLGSVAAVLLAPLVFDSVLEYPVALLAGAVLLPRVSAHIRARHLLAATAGVGGVAIVLAGWLGTTAATVTILGLLALGGAVVLGRHPLISTVALSLVAIALIRDHQRGEIHAERTFFGVTRVHETDAFRELISGTTMHGRQALDDPAGRRPLAYYAPGSPVSQVLDAARDARPLDIGVIGLGAGSLAAYGQPGDRITFYEIDPAVVRVAEDPSLFGFMSSSAAAIEVRLGDGRRLVEAASGTRHRVIVLDAFSSDAIPVHLLTSEAFASYRARLTADGVLAVHISNRFFDLAPPLATLAERVGWEARLNRWDPPPSAPSGSASTAWIVLTRSPAVLDRLAQHGGWSIPAPRGTLWTDDHSDLLATLHLTR